MFHYENAFSYRNVQTIKHLIFIIKTRLQFGMIDQIRINKMDYENFDFFCGFLGKANLIEGYTRSNIRVYIQIIYKIHTNLYMKIKDYVESTLFK